MTAVTWCAEVGSAHKGEKSLAYEMIRRFSEAGADILKFQFGWTPEAQQKHGLEYKPERFVDAWAGDLAQWCEYFGVELMASIWSLEGLEAAFDVGMTTFKISHQVWAHDPELVEQILERSYRAYVSVTPDRRWNDDDRLKGGKIFPVFVSPEYPTYPGRLHAPDKYTWMDGWLGYSDHSHGIEPCLLAVARGALYIEKHVTLDKTDLTVRDTPFSADPAEFAEMVRLGRGMRRLLDAGA